MESNQRNDVGFARLDLGKKYCLADTVVLPLICGNADVARHTQAPRLKGRLELRTTCRITPAHTARQKFRGLVA